MSTLKPCPFCGWGTIVDMGGLFSHSAGCNSCGTKTKNYKTWEEAVTAWNARAETEAEKKIEHVRAECEKLWIEASASCSNECLEKLPMKILNILESGK